MGYFASTSLKIKHFQELFESAISNLCILDKHLVCILCEFNFRNGHFPKYPSKVKHVIQNLFFLSEIIANKHLGTQGTLVGEHVTT